MIKIHEKKLAQYKNKVRLCKLIKMLILLVSPFLISSFVVSFLGMMKINFTVLILIVLIFSVAFILVKYQNHICAKADQYVSENMLRPIVSHDVAISFFEANGIIERQKLANASIFPNHNKYILGKSHFKGNVNDFQIEYFDFVSYDRYGLYRTISYGKKGHFAILSNGYNFPGYFTIRPSSKLKEISDKIFNKIMHNEAPTRLFTGNNDFDSCYTITTNCPDAADNILTSELIDIFLKHKKDKRHVFFLEFRDNMIYIFVENDIWKVDSYEDGSRRYLANSNALWGAKDANEVNERLMENWKIMLQLIDITSDLKNTLK